MLQNSNRLFINYLPSCDLFGVPNEEKHEKLNCGGYFRDVKHALQAPHGGIFELTLYKGAEAAGERGVSRIRAKKVISLIWTNL